MKRLKSPLGVLTVRVSTDTVKGLDSVAARLKITRSALIVDCLDAVILANKPKARAKARNKAA